MNARWALLFAGVALSACGGGTRGNLPSLPLQPMSMQIGHGSGLRLPSALAGDRVAAAAGPIALSPAKLNLFGTGKTGKVTVTEKNYRKSFTMKTSCSKVATIVPASAKGPSFVLTITAKAKGNCTVTIADAKNHKAVLPVVIKPGGQLVTSLLVPIHAPRAIHHGRQPKYISASTQAMIVNISGPTSVNVVSGLTSLSPGCSLTLNGLACTFGASLASCPSAAPCYTATFTTYDAYDGTTNTIPAGAAPLSVSVSTFGIADNQTNTVNFNFSGIPATIALVPNTPMVAQNGNVFDLVGPGVHKFFAEALDADNNVIAGIGGPSYTISSTGSMPLTVTQPPTGSPRFTVTPPAALWDETITGTVTVTAAYPAGTTDGCAQPGAVCTGAFAMDMQSLLAVAGGSDSVGLFAAEKGIGPLLTLTSGLGTVYDLQFDSQGNLYSADANNNDIVVYPIGSAIPSRTITAGLSSPLKMTFDPAGNLFVLNHGKQSSSIPGSVSVYPPGSSTPSTTIAIKDGASPIYNAYEIAVDSSDDMWIMTQTFDSDFQPHLGTIVYIPHGQSAGTELAGLVDPVSIAADQTGKRLFVSDQTNYIFQHPYQCGQGGAGHYCPVYEYNYATNASPPQQLVSSVGYGGNLQYVPDSHTGFGSQSLGLFADNDYGTNFAYYAVNRLPIPLSNPPGFTGGLEPGTSQAIAVDGLGDVFSATGLNNTVPGFAFSTFSGGGEDQPVTAFVTMTNGLRAPAVLAITP
ncbi:MAG TPA: hypothetical protein VK760_07765 [Candidatus Acidoferrales bacterium]|nr:hypothetical protein [Candidatus Acidoferrales bacterium]